MHEEDEDSEHVTMEAIGMDQASAPANSEAKKLTQQNLVDFDACNSVKTPQ